MSEFGSVCDRACATSRGRGESLESCGTATTPLTLGPLPSTSELVGPDLVSLPLLPPDLPIWNTVFHREAVIRPGDGTGETLWWSNVEVEVDVEAVKGEGE